jgi:hypothetical protein
MTGRRKIFLAGALAIGGLILLYAVAVRPSNARDWTPNEAVLPAAEFDGPVVRLRNVRNTRYRTSSDYAPAYYDTTYRLDQLERVWFGVVPFAERSVTAHTFLSFEFLGSRFVAVSVEARKERDEQYHFLKGLFRRYELMYVVADERDVIGLRTNYRRDAVYLYPIAAARQRVQALFVAMLTRANALRAQPEFYNTLTANCTSTIVRHVNTLVPGRVPFSYRWLLPGFADRLAYDLGLIDSDLPYDSLRSRFRVTEAAQALGDSASFSVGIRRTLLQRRGAGRPSG